jgi:hypothetical protein
MQKIQAMTPIIASVCMRVIELEQMNAERRAIKGLACQITETTKMADADKILLDTLVELSGSCGAIMMQYSDSNFCYCIATVWNVYSPNGNAHPQLATLFNGFSCNEVTMNDVSCLLAGCSSLLRTAGSDNGNFMPRKIPLTLPQHKKIILLVDAKTATLTTLPQPKVSKFWLPADKSLNTVIHY